MGHHGLQWKNKKEREERTCLWGKEGFLRDLKGSFRKKRREEGVIRGDWQEVGWWSGEPRVGRTGQKTPVKDFVLESRNWIESHHRETQIESQPPLKPSPSLAYTQSPLKLFILLGPVKTSCRQHSAIFPSDLFTWTLSVYLSGKTHFLWPWPPISLRKGSLGTWTAGETARWRLSLFLYIYSLGSGGVK